MNLIPILLIKKAQDQRRRSSSSSSRSSSSRSGSYDRHDYSSSSSSYSTPKTLEGYASTYSSYSMTDKLYSRIVTVMHNSPDMMRVYGNIHTHITSSINAYTTDAIAKLVELPAIDDRFFTARANAINKVFSVPVDLLHVNPHGWDEDYSYSYLRYNPNATDPRESLEYKRFQSATIYGMKITEEMLSPGVNPFRDRYDKYVSEHPTYEEDYIRTKKRVLKLEKNPFLLKIIPGRKDKLILAKKELDKAEGIKRQAERYQEQAENFDNLSNEERAYLREYVQAEKALQDSNVEHRDELRILMELSGRESVYYSKSVLSGFYQEAVDALNPTDREVYDKLPREIMSTLARANEEEFAALDNDENRKTSDSRFTVDKLINSEIVSSSVAVLQNVPFDELTEIVE